MTKESKNTGSSKQIIALLAVAAVAIGSIFLYDGATNTDDSVATYEPTTSQTKNITIASDGKTASYLGVDGRNALELLKSYTSAETKTFSGLGEYVTSINGLASEDGKNFWSFYVNDAAAQVGAGEYITKNTDRIEWRLEDVTPFAQ